MIACVLCIVVWGAASQGAPADEAQWELATFAGSLSEASWCGGAVSGADGLMWSPVTEPEKFLPLPTRGVVLLRGKVHGVKELGFSISPATVLLDGVSVDVPSLFPHIGMRPMGQNLRGVAVVSLNPCLFACECSAPADSSRPGVRRPARRLPAPTLAITCACCTTPQ